MELNLSFGLSFADLYDLKPKGNIQKVHQAFKLFNNRRQAISRKNIETFTKPLICADIQS